MASAGSLLCEEQFLCSICLDVFTEPVSTPCGHNFCKPCITKYWDKNDQCHCPMCKMPFENRPNLLVNTLVSEMAAQFKPAVDVKAANSHSQEADKPVEVPCDFCCGTKVKALKSCLVCLASYCETHLEPHQRVAALKRHKLIDPVENLEDRMCKRHDKMLELFCRTDQLCVCVMCTEHKTHDTVPLEEECEEKKAQLDKMKAEVQQMIQERQLKVRQINNSLQLSKKDTQEEVAKTAEVFTALVASIQRNQAELIKVVEEKQRATEKQAEVFIEELEEEITELQRRSTELECLSHSEDHLHLLQSFPSFSSSPHTKKCSNIIIRRNLSLEVMRRAVAHLEETHNKKMTGVLKYIEMIKEHIGRLPEPVTLRKIQELYAVDVTLDPNTAHAELIVSEDRKQVRYGDIVQDLPDNPERFDEDLNVIGKEGFSSGKFYFEAQVKEDDWDIGVVSESSKRKGDISYSPAEGYWIIWLKEGNILQALNDPIICLSLSQKPEKVGVFVEYEEGRVSFYDVKAGNLMYCFMDCNFTEKIYPFFSPSYDEVDPLIITPVELTE